MANILIFLIALLIIAILFLARFLELRAGKISSWGNFMNRSDAFVESAWYKGRLFWKIVSYAIVVSFKAVGPEVKDLYISINKQTKNRFRNTLNSISGKKKSTKRGAASFYLKQISEDKK